MPLYVTVRAGPSPATSVPVLVVADQRLIQALVDELVRMAGTQTERDVSSLKASLAPPHPLRRLPISPLPRGKEG